MKITVSYEVEKSRVIEITEANQEVIKNRCVGGITIDNLKKLVLEQLKQDKTISELEEVHPFRIKKVEIKNEDISYIINELVSCCDQNKLDPTINYCPMCGKKL